MKQLSSIALLVSIIFMFGINTQAQYLSQQFTQALTAGNAGSGTIISNTGVTSDPVYVNDPASNSQFTFLSTNNALALIEINGTDGRMRLTRPGSGTVYVVRNTNFTGSPTAMMVSFDFNAETTAGTSGGALEFMLGQNFPNSNNNPVTTDKHSVFFVNTKNPTGTPGTWGVTPVSASSSSAFTTTETITWYVNNSGSPILYTGPDGSSNTIADDTYDLWVANTLYYNDQAANAVAAALNNFEIRISGGNGTYTVDNLLIQDIPPVGTPPTVTTTAISNITQTTASSGGNVTDGGTSPVTVRGVCWSTNQNPTIADDKTEDGSGTGSFTSSITDLIAGTTYYVRAYATSLAGTGYGAQETFMTLAGVANIDLASDNPAVPSGDITAGTLKNPVYKFNLTVAIANTQLNEVDFTTQGTYTSTDLIRLQLWFNLSDNLGTAVQIGNDITTNLGGVSNLSFETLTQDINVGEMGYLWITADVSGTAVPGKTFSIDAVTTSGLTFSSGIKSGTAFGGGVQIIVAAGNPDVHFRTKATGNWNATSTWETSPDEVVWQDATLTPSFLSRVINVRSPHIVTVTDTVSVDQVVVDAGASIIVNGTPVVFTIVDGPNAVDMHVDGILKSVGIANASPGPHSVTAEGVLEFGSTSVYEHAQNSGAIPISVWGVGSTMKLTGTTSGAPANRNQNFHHLIFDTPGLTSNLNMGFDEVTIGGDISVVNTGAASRWYLCGPVGGDSVYVTINGSITQSAGQFSAHGTGNGSTLVEISVHGNITVTGGNFACTRGSQGNSGTTNWILYGNNFSMSNATTQNSNTTDAKFLFSGQTQQNLTLSAITFSGGGFPFAVATNATLDAGTSQVEGSGIFTLHDDATLRTGNTQGLDGLLQNTGTKTLSTLANYTFNGTAAQITGTQLPSTVSNLTVNNSAGVTLSNGVTVNGTLAVNNGDLHLDGKTITLGTSATLAETPGNTLTDITGKIITTRNLNAPTGLNVGGLGAMLSTSEDLGSTTIERYHFASVEGSNEGIFRVFNIVPTNNSSLNATIRFYYDESELNSITESNLILFKSPTGLSNTWTSQGGVVNSVDNYVELSSIGDFSYWTLSQSGAATFSFNVSVANGWNMVSAPGLNTPDQNVGTWWPNLQGAVYRYQSGYVSVTTTTPGLGYWMKNNGAQVYSYPSIQIVPHAPIAGASGWNMIGGYEISATASLVTTVPAGLQSGPIYKYSAGYQTATTIDPGYGYWIKLTGAGQIIIPETFAKGEAPVEYFPENWGKIVLTDATGINYTLYAVKGEVNLDQYELPPAPMAEMFDIRFSSGRIAEDINSSMKTIDMSGVTYPVTVRAEGMDMRLMDETGKTVNVNLKSGENVVISDATIQKLMVTGELIPAVYALEQNYPNPFNPSTVIEFSLPEDVSNVKLSIYNALGEKVAELVNTNLVAGKYQYQWNAKNVATGMYIYELRTDKFVSVKKMLLLK